MKVTLSENEMRYLMWALHRDLTRVTAKNYEWKKDKKVAHEVYDKVQSAYKDSFATQFDLSVPNSRKVY